MSLSERWGIYKRSTGLNPLGPTGPRGQAAGRRGGKEEAMRRRIIRCPLCDGEGLLYVEGASKDFHSICPHCDGMGRALDGGFALVLAALHLPPSPQTDFNARRGPRS